MPVSTPNAQSLGIQATNTFVTLRSEKLYLEPVSCSKAYLEMKALVQGYLLLMMTTVWRTQHRYRESQEAPPSCTMAQQAGMTPGIPRGSGHMRVSS